MATRTELLRAALERRGFKLHETRSAKPCFVGKHASGVTVYLFLDKVGGARWAREPKLTAAIALSSRSIQLLLRGDDSKFFGPATTNPPKEG